MPNPTKVVTNEDLYKTLMLLEKQIAEIKIQNSEIKADLEVLKCSVKEDIAHLNQNVNKLEEENKLLKKRLLQNDRTIKKYNLIVYGVQDEDGEDLLSTVTNILGENLNIEIKEFDIRDAFRINSSQTNKPRPIVLNFLKYSKKNEILINSSKLKGTGIYISNDYAYEDWEKRKVLMQHMKAARNAQISAKIVGSNSLLVDGQKLAYEDLLETNENITDLGKFYKQKKVTGRIDGNQTSGTGSDQVTLRPRINVKKTTKN